MKKTIKRRTFLKAVGAAGTAFTFGQPVFSAATNNRKKPNVLFIMTDQQPISCVGIYGENPVIQTPFIDKLAKRGCIFEQTYIAAFPCAPSRGCMLTGRYMHNHKVINNDIALDPDIPTLGDICKKAGYNTANFGKWHLGGWMHRGHLVKPYGGSAYGFGEWRFHLRENEDGWSMTPVAGGAGEDYPQNGFDTWAGGWKQYKEWLIKNGLEEIVRKNPELGCHNILSPGNYETIGTSGMDQRYHVEAFIAEQAETFIQEQAQSDRPWCAVASFYGPHPPVAPPKPWDEMYSLDQVKLPGNHKDSMEGKPLSQKNPNRYKLGTWTDEQWKDYIRKYWGFTSYVDQQIGRVLHAVEKTGQMDNTIIVFTSDHGNMNGEHGMMFKTLGTGYDELFRVPMIIYLPGESTVSRVHGLVSHVDLVPTLFAACQIPQPEGLDGKSLIPLLKGSTESHRDIVFADATNSSLISRDKKYKFALHWNRNSIDELYDLENDPGEMNNLAYAKAGKIIADRKRTEIVNWLKETHHRYAHIIEKKAFDKNRRCANRS